MRNRVRLKIELSRPSVFDVTPLRNEFTAATPIIFLERAVDFEIGIFFQDVLQSVSDLQSITFEVKTVTNGVVDVDSAAVITISLGAGDLNTGLTRDQWDNGNAQHAKFSATTAMTLLDMTGAINNRKQFAGVFCAVDSDAERITLGTFPLLVVEDGCGAGGTPPTPGDPTYLTAAEVVAMMNGFVKQIMDPGQSITLPSGNGRWETIIYTDNETGKLQTVKNGPLN